MMQQEGPATDVGGPRARLKRRLGSVLAAPYFPLVAAVLAFGFALPALGAGLVLDDYYHRTVLLEKPRFRELLGPPSDMFRFFRGDPVRTGRMVDLGIFPWWTDPYVKAEFLQALTVLTHRLDYALWPDSPMLMHAHSLLWLAAVVGLAGVYYRRMLGPTWVAGAAALLFALDDARGATVGFIANRNVLVGATFGVAALILHDRWRRDGSRAAAFLAPLLLLAALFSKEENIGTCAYLGAYAIFVDRAGLWRGCLALWPHATAVVAWRSLRELWGYGVRNVGLYIDPISDPGPYFTALVQRVPIQLLGQWTPIPAELGVLLKHPALTYLWCLALVVLAVLFLVMTPLLRADRLARFWAAGMVLAVIPVGATAPMDRLLTYAGIGAAGLLAQYWAFVFGRSPDAPAGRLWRVPAATVAWLLVATQAVISPLSLPFRAAFPLGPSWIEQRLNVRTPLPESIGEQTLVIVNAPSPASAHYVIFKRELGGLPLPGHIRVLAPAMPSVTIRRLDRRTLAVRPEGGYLRWPLDRVFRSERRPLAAGEQIKLTGVTVTILSVTEDGRPIEASFRFDVPLESPSLYWLCYRGDSFEPFVPPEVGEEREIRFDWRALLAPPWLAGRSSRAAP